jgi:hypothetical protein
MVQTNLSRYRDSLAKLITLGNQMFADLASIVAPSRRVVKEAGPKVANDGLPSFRGHYQNWYTEAYAVLRQLLPERVEEFESYYKPDPKRKSMTLTNYTIQDWLSGIAPAPDAFGKKAYEEGTAVIMRYQMQLAILNSIETRFESSLFEIRQLVQADFFDSELDCARELLRSGFGRGAGSIAGVVLEKHLQQVCKDHKIATKKQHPTIADLNDLLKAGNIAEVPTWRQIQRLGDLRNLATHNKEREPTDEELRELIDGTEKITKTLY